jgi:metal-responsive CopG/Arc/MetJ family transcriptional regulator
MKRKTVDKRKVTPQNPSWVRASVSFPSDVYQILGELAKNKKVSLAWVVREAAERYVAEAKAENEKSK